MKKIYLFLFALISVTLAQAQTFADNGINYNITDATNFKVEVGSNSGFSGVANIPATVVYNSQNYDVTSIRYDAFKNCYNLFSVIIPNSVTTIGFSAFESCASLEVINIPNSVISIDFQAFAFCAVLYSIYIPNSVSSIGGGAFSFCNNLNSVTVNWTIPLPIGSTIFSGNNTLSNVTLNVPAGTGAAYDSEPYWTDFIISIQNQSPTDIALSATSINENVAANSVVGALTSTDPDTGNTHTYTLVTGTGSTDNASFNINGANLRITNSPDFETQNSYTIRIRTTDQGGLFYEKEFIIIINNANENPLGIFLSNDNINENVANNFTIGLLTSSDPDVGNTHTYLLVSGAGDADNTSFNINGANLRITNSPNFEVKNSYSVLIRTTDQGGLTSDNVFAIYINDINENPTNISLSNASINENVAANFTVGDLTSLDPDAGNSFVYSLVSGAGDTDNASFNINGANLRITNSPNFEIKSSYSIRIRTTDQGGLLYEKSFTITINNVNETPTDIALSTASLNENVPANTTVGTLSSTDPDTANTHTYTLVTGTGSTDNLSFNIVNNELKMSGIPDFETKSSYAVRIRTTDQGGLFYEKAFTITINDLVEAPRGCWANVSAGGYHTLAIAQDGTLWSWGDNANGQLGAGVVGTDKLNPTQVSTQNTWRAISAGEFYSLAIKADGTLWAWGQNGNGQLGNNTTTQQNTPVQIGTDTNWSKVYAGYKHSMAVKTNGTLWAWGRNANGQIGNNTIVQQNTPLQIGTDTDWATIKLGQWHSIALKANGTLWAWGRNNFNQLGNGNTTQVNIPTQIGTDVWSSVQVGDSHNLALKANGTLWVWGDNFAGMLGTGDTSRRSTPTQIGTDTNWTSIAAGAYHSYATKSTGTLWAWGDNYFGQVGNGNFTQQNTPTQAGTATDWYSVIAGNYFGISQKTTGNFVSWGDNQGGQLGNGAVTPNTTGQNTPASMGCSGNALSFDGNDDQIEIQNTGTGALGDNSANEDYTIFITFKFSNTISNNIFSKSINISGDQGYKMGTDSNGNLYFDQAYGGVFSRALSPSPLLENEYYRVTVTFNFATKTHELYINGSLVATKTETLTPMFTSTTSKITLNQSFTTASGSINTLMYFNETLTSSIISFILSQNGGARTNNTYQTNNLVQIPGLIAQYKMNQGNANADNTGVTTLFNEVVGSPIVATLQNFALNGTTSNWIYDATINDVTLGTNNFSITDTIKVYPNPSTGIFNISIADDASLEIHDMLGKTIYTNKVKVGNNLIDISNYQSGLYLLNIKSEKGSITKKIIKE